MLVITVIISYIYVTRGDRTRAKQSKGASVSVLDVGGFCTVSVISISLTTRRTVCGTCRGYLVGRICGSGNDNDPVRCGISLRAASRQGLIITFSRDNRMLGIVLRSRCLTTHGGG